VDGGGELSDLFAGVADERLWEMAEAALFAAQDAVPGSAEQLECLARQERVTGALKRRLEERARAAGLL
jgi:hypothetical protein